MERQAGSGPSGPLGLSYRRIGDTLSSVTAAVVLSAAVTLLPVVSQPGVAVADTAGSLPGLTSDQELQFQQFQKYQQQQSAYEQMQAKAQPFQKVEVNKGRIWLLFVLGASSLFGVTVVVENNGAWFPAISRANKAMKASMKAIEERERLEKLGMLDDVRAEAMEGVEAAIDVDVVESAPMSTQDAVLAGLKEASANAKETMKSLKEEGKRPSMIPLEISASDDEEEIAVNVVDMQAEGTAEDDELEDIGSLLDEPIPGAEDDTDDEDRGEDEAENEIQNESVGEKGASQGLAGVAAGREDVAERDTRKPLFEISGEDIDASITNRAQQFKEELERGSSNDDNTSTDSAGLGVDLSNISLEELQKELEKRNSIQ